MGTFLALQREALPCPLVVLNPEFLAEGQLLDSLLLNLLHGRLVLMHYGSPSGVVLVLDNLHLSGIGGQVHTHVAQQWVKGFVVNGFAVNLDLQERGSVHLGVQPVSARSEQGIDSIGRQARTTPVGGLFLQQKPLANSLYFNGILFRSHLVHRLHDSGGVCHGVRPEAVGQFFPVHTFVLVVDG